MDVIEQRIRERAYYLWEAEGRPEGREVEYWERARRLVDAGEAAKPANGHAPENRGGNGATGGARRAAPASPVPAPPVPATPGPAAKSGGKRRKDEQGAAKSAKRKASRSK